MKNKTLVLAIIFVLVLVVASVVYVFFVGGPEKPDSVSVQCGFACESGQETAFCTIERTVNENLKATCYELATKSQYSQYNVATCSEISCESSGGSSTQTDDKTCVSGLNSEWVDADENGECPEREGMFVTKRNDASDESPVAGQICCDYYE